MTPETINEFFSFLYRGQIGEITFWIRFVAGILTSAFAAAIVVVAVKLYQLSHPIEVTEREEEEAAQAEEKARPWDGIRKKIESLDPSEWTNAVIQADAIVDGVLRDMGLPGDTMGERLRALDSAKLSSYNELWEAHKIRNRIAHEVGATLSHKEANRAIVFFEHGLRELGYLEE